MGQGRTGRPRQTGDEKWATVREAGQALGVTEQAIRSRIKAGTIPFMDYMDESNVKHYRIDREWLEQEAAKKGEEAASRTDLSARTAEVLHFFSEWGERLIDEINDQRGDVKGAIEGQRKEVVANQVRLLGIVEGVKNDNAEMFKQVRTALARMEEEGRQEAEYQQSNLELAREMRNLQQQNLALSEKVYELLSRVERAESERDAERRDRRGFFRRLFSD